MSNNNLVPNSFPTPNVFVDKIAYFLSPEENTVLAKAIREILGFNDKIPLRRAAISLSVFVYGKTDRSGNQLCLGCGLGIQAVRNSLEKLNQFNILIKVGQPTGDGQMYWLQDQESEIDWDGLRDRKTLWESKNQERTVAATQKRIENRGVTSDVTLTSDDTPGVTSDDTPGVTSDVNKESQGKPEESQNLLPKGNNGSSELDDHFGDHPRGIKTEGLSNHTADEIRDGAARAIRDFDERQNSLTAEEQATLDKIVGAGWLEDAQLSRSNELLTALVYFMTYTNFKKPPSDWSLRNLWIWGNKTGTFGIKTHLSEFGLDKLPDLYRQVQKKVDDSNGRIEVKGPMSFYGFMASINARATPKKERIPARDDLTGEIIPGAWEA